MSSWILPAHAVGASLALGLGTWQWWRRIRGLSTAHEHRTLGRIWVVLMYWTVLSSFFVQQLDPGHFSWLHGLSVFTFGTLTIGVWAAVRGNIPRHRGYMTGTYYGLVGAFVGAVAVPQRDIPQLVVHRPVVFTLTVLAITVAVVSVIALCTPRRVTPTPLEVAVAGNE